MRILTIEEMKRVAGGGGKSEGKRGHHGGHGGSGGSGGSSNPCPVTTSPATTPPITTVAGG